MRKRPILSAFIALAAAVVLCLVLEVIIVELTRESVGSIRARLARDLPEGTNEQTITEYLSVKGMTPGSYVTKGPEEPGHVPANTKIVRASVTRGEVFPMYAKEVVEIIFILDQDRHLTRLYVWSYDPDAS